MDAPTIAAFASAAVALFALLGLVGPVYLRLGKVEGEVKANRERSDEQFREARERSDAQHQELLERQREQRERSDAQHAETLAEIRRLDRCFPIAFPRAGRGYRVSNSPSCRF